MAFTLPTITETKDFLRALGLRLLPTRDWSPRGTAGKWSAWLAGAVVDVMAALDAVRKDLNPLTAEGEALADWAHVKQVTRKSATPARKSDALEVTGTPASTVSIGDELVSAGGLRFQIAENETVPAAGVVNVDVVAISTGAQTRLPAGTVLTFVSPPTGIEEEARLVLDLDEDGVDEEPEGEWRNRVLAKYGDPPLGGAVADYEQWSLEVTGVASAYVYPIRGGLGTVDVAALHTGSGTARLLDTTERGELLDYLLTKAPAHLARDGNVRVLEVVEVEVDTEVTVTSNGEAQWARDWDDATPLVVSTWTLATRTLVFTTDRPDSMVPGHRILFKDATVTPADSGKQWVIESLSSTNAVVLEEAPDFTPAATDTVYSGGPLVDPVRDAILAHFDSLGPSNPDAVVYGPWEANVRPENLYRIAQDTDGVRKSVVIAPASTVEPEDNPYPDDATVYLAVPRRTLVRYA
jgi:uncharacterized phage protein gp47/JayE